MKMTIVNSGFKGLIGYYIIKGDMAEHNDLSLDDKG